MKSILSNKRILILVPVNIALVLLCVFFIRGIHAYEEKTADVYKQIDISKKSQLSYLALKQSIQNTQSSREKIEQFIVSQDETVSFIEKIEGLSVKTGAVVNLTNVSRTSSGENSSLMFTVNADGTFREVYHFLSLVEMLPYRLSVKSVSFALDTDSVASGVASGAVPGFARRAPVIAAGPGTSGGSAGVEEKSTSTSMTTSGKTWHASVVFQLMSFDSTKK